MSAWLAASPVLVPMATVVATALAQKNPRAQTLLSFLGIAVLVACALGLLAAAQQGAGLRTVFGDWGAPFGIEFYIDRTSAAMLMVTALMGLASLLFLCSDADTQPRHPMLLPLMHGLLLGVGGSFATADIFNLYVWLEVGLVCALGLLALGGRLDQLDGAFKYFVLNIIGTLLLLAAVGLIYGATGHLNYDALAHAAAQLNPWLLGLLVSVLLLALLIKAGAFPLYAWLPAAYHTLPAPVLGLFAGTLTMLGVYAVLRMGGDVFAIAPDWVYLGLGWIGVASMLIGVLGAAYHWDMRRILAFHTVSQVGYILLAISLANLAGNAAAVFYTVHHFIVKANLFLIAAIIWRLTGNYDLRKVGGLYKTHPWLGLLFLFVAMALVGIPPLSGFWAKLLVLQEALALGLYLWTFIALLVSVLTLYSMVKIWMEAFWKPHPDKHWQPPAHSRLWPAYAATLGLAAATLAISLHPQPLIEFVQAAALSLGAR